MTYTKDYITFEKSGATVNVKIENKTVDAFTNYDIKTVTEFKKACEQYLNEN